MTWAGVSALEKRQMKAGEKNAYGLPQIITGCAKKWRILWPSRLQCCVEDRHFSSEQHSWCCNMVFHMVLPCAGWICSQIPSHRVRPQVSRLRLRIYVTINSVCLVKNRRMSWVLRTPYAPPWGSGMCCFCWEEVMGTKWRWQQSPSSMYGSGKRKHQQQWTRQKFNGFPRTVQKSSGWTQNILPASVGIYYAATGTLHGCSLGLFVLLQGLLHAAVEGHSSKPCYTWQHWLHTGMQSHTLQLFGTEIHIVLHLYRDIGMYSHV